MQAASSSLRRSPTVPSRLQQVFLHVRDPTWLSPPAIIGADSGALRVQQQQLYNLLADPKKASPLGTGLEPHR